MGLGGGESSDPGDAGQSPGNDSPGGPSGGGGGLGWGGSYGESVATGMSVGGVPAGGVGYGGQAGGLGVESDLSKSWKDILDRAFNNFSIATGLTGNPVAGVMGAAIGEIANFAMDNPNMGGYKDKPDTGVGSDQSMFQRNRDLQNASQRQRDWLAYLDTIGNKYKNPNAGRPSGPSFFDPTMSSKPASVLEEDDPNNPKGSLLV